MSASPRQIDYIASLIAHRVVPDETRAAIDAKLHLMTPRQVSAIIDGLKALPRNPQAALPVLEPGKVYVSADVVIRVQKNRTTGRPYALVLTDSGQFVYDGSAYRAYAATAELISFERAVELGMRHGRCIHCGRDLTAVDSVVLSIGPVCAARHHGVSQSELIRRQRELNPQRELVAA